MMNAAKSQYIVCQDKKSSNEVFPGGWVKENQFYKSSAFFDDYLFIWVSSYIKKAEVSRNRRNYNVFLNVNNFFIRKCVVIIYGMYITNFL